MPRLLAHVEGETEELFVNELLSDHLLRFGYESVRARIVGSAHSRNRRGGIRPWQSVKGDVLRHLAGDSGAAATLFVDYYALPGDWPGRLQAESKQGASTKAEILEAALLTDFTQTAAGRINPSRFVPFVAMHEFEGLLFSSPEIFAASILRPELGPSFAAIRDRFETPEDINDSEHTAPSKRIRILVPKYEKPEFGMQAAVAIGLETIRSQCPHFNHWLSKLENLPRELAYLD